MLGDVGIPRGQSPEISSTNVARAGHVGQPERQASPLPGAWLACGLIGLLALSQTGCGQKGPLYLPAPAASAPNPSSSAK